MEGHTRRAGAVAGVTTVRNPIRLARAVMEHSAHVMLVGDGAEKFADERTEHRTRRQPTSSTPRNAWQAAARRREAEAQQAQHEPATAPALFRHRRRGGARRAGPHRRRHLDRRHDQQAVRPRRRLADHRRRHLGRPKRCGVSGTGWGEFFIRAAVAHDICARIAYPGDLAAAPPRGDEGGRPGPGGDDGGVIALDADGNIAMPFNTAGMYRGWIRPDGVPHVALYSERDAAISSACWCGQTLSLSVGAASRRELLLLNRTAKARGGTPPTLLYNFGTASASRSGLPEWKRLQTTLRSSRDHLS